MRGNCKVAKLLTAAQSCRSSIKSNCPLLANNQSTERRESFSKKAALRRLFLLFLFRVKLPHLLVEFIVDMLAEPGLAAGLHCTVRREPFHAAVLVGLDREHVRVVRDEKIRDVQMQVRGDVLPALDMTSTVSTSSEKMSSLAGRTFLTPLSSRTSLSATASRFSSPSACPPSHDHES